MTSQGTAHGRFQRAIQRGHVQAAEMAAREMGRLSPADALSLCELLANVDPARYERAALRWLSSGSSMNDRRHSPRSHLLQQRLPSFGTATATSALRH